MADDQAEITAEEDARCREAAESVSDAVMVVRPLAMALLRDRVLEPAPLAAALLVVAGEVSESLGIPGVPHDAAALSWFVAGRKTIARWEAEARKAAAGGNLNG